MRPAARRDPLARFATGAAFAIALLGRAPATSATPPAVVDAPGRSPARAVAAEDVPDQGPRATKAERGSLLVADPSLRRGGSPFAESVVLLLERRAAGAIGIVLDRPGKAKPSDFDRGFSDLDLHAGVVFEGGPLERERLVLLVQAPEAPRDSLRIVDGVWVTGSIDDVRDLVRRGESGARVRAFAGRAAWGPGQLDEELRRGEWLVAPADASSVFTADPASLWRKLFARLSAKWVRDEPPVGGPAPRPPRPTIARPRPERQRADRRPVRPPGVLLRRGDRAQASAAWAAESRAIGTRKGEHET